MKLLASLVVLMTLAGSRVAAAQSLAEVAEREESRRKSIQNPSRVYTNDDLKGANPVRAPTPAKPLVSPPVVAPPADDPSSAPKDEAPSPKPAASADRAQGSDSARKDAIWWRSRIAKLEEDVDRTRTYMDALQSRINALTTDFVNRDDPYQRAVIEGDRVKAIAELERLKKELQLQTKAVDDLREEARRAGVPPGWLR